MSASWNEIGPPRWVEPFSSGDHVVTTRTGSCDCLRCCDKSEMFWRYLAAVGIGAWICLSIGGFYVLAVFFWQAFTTF